MYGDMSSDPTKGTLMATAPTTDLDEFVDRGRALTAEWEDVQPRYEEVRVARNDWVIDALNRRIPHREIMEITHLSRARLDQIKNPTKYVKP